MDRIKTFGRAASVLSFLGWAAYIYAEDPSWFRDGDVYGPLILLLVLSWTPWVVRYLWRGFLNRIRDVREALK